MSLRVFRKRIPARRFKKNCRIDFGKRNGAGSNPEHFKNDVSLLRNRWIAKPMGIYTGPLSKWWHVAAREAEHVGIGYFSGVSPFEFQHFIFLALAFEQRNIERGRKQIPVVYIGSVASCVRAVRNF